MALLLALLALPTLVAGVVAQEATPGATVPPIIVTFVTADDSTFRAEMRQPTDIAAVEDALAGDGYAGIPIGALAYGDGGINAPHEWHMEGTTLAEVTIELCDGTASMVDDDVAYWVDTVGQFCPWSATVVDIEPLQSPDEGETPGGGDSDGISDLPETGDGAASLAMFGGGSGEASSSILLAIALGLATIGVGRVLVRDDA